MSDLDELAEFLLARIPEDVERDHRKMIEGVVPDADERALRAVFAKTMQWQAAELAGEGRRFAVYVWWAMPWVGRAPLRKMAARYAAHPDYRLTWA